MRKTAISIWQEVDDLVKNANNLPYSELTDKLVQAITHPTEITDWQKYAHLSEHKYTRNLIHPATANVSQTDDDDPLLDLPFQLVLMGWGPGQSSLIHDHAGSECCMRVLSGALCEDLYEVHDLPRTDQDQPQQCNVTLKQSQTIHTDQWTSITNSLGWHRVSNASKVEPSFSLHLYYPPIGQYKVIVCGEEGRASRKTTVKTCRYDTVNGLFEE